MHNHKHQKPHTAKDAQVKAAPRRGVAAAADTRRPPREQECATGSRARATAATAATVAAEDGERRPTAMLLHNP